MNRKNDLLTILHNTMNGNDVMEARNGVIPILVRPPPVIDMDCHGKANPRVL